MIAATPTRAGLALILAISLWSPAVPAHEAGPVATLPVPAALAVTAPLAPLPGVAELRFRELFTQPVGPRGLQPSARLLALAGQRVRLVGWMAAADPPTPGLLVLSPLPVSLGSEDEAYADDLPPSAVHVHLAPAQAEVVLPPLAGLMALTGTLELGPLAEADGRRSFVRLRLDAEASALLARAAAAPR